MCHRLAASVLLVALGCAQWSDPLRPGVRQKPTRGDLGIVFKTVDEAALSGCAYIWKNEPRATRYEYCGVIYRDAEGIKAGLPETSDMQGYCKGPSEPPGTDPQAGYHNHHDRGDFSRDDRKRVTGLTRYLCTPSGLVMRMTPKGLVIVK